MVADVIAGGELMPDVLVADSPAMRDVLRDVRQASRSLADLLIVGEPGTGREQVARAIHAQGPHAFGPFVTLDCGADSRPHDLLLFGVCADGTASRPELPRLGPDAVLLAALDGSLFLRQITDMPLRSQAALARLLRVRETWTVQGQPVRVTARVMVAVEPGFDVAVNEGSMRADLYRHLSPIRIEVPPLRRRREDIPELARQLLVLIAARLSMPPKTITRTALALLAALPWRGNAPELALLLERVFTSAPSRVIDVDDLLPHVPLGSPSPQGGTAETLKDARSRFEREYITAVLDQCAWRIPQAARMLGVARPNLYRKMRALGIDRP